MLSEISLFGQRKGTYERDWSIHQPRHTPTKRKERTPHRSLPELSCGDDLQRERKKHRRSATPPREGGKEGVPL
jgi:hypothetical protein